MMTIKERLQAIERTERKNTERWEGAKRMKTMEKVTELYAYGKCFIIAVDCHGYWGIGEDLLENGRLTRTLNGLDGNLSDTLDDCIRACRIAAGMEYYIAQGMSVVEAATYVWKLMND